MKTASDIEDERRRIDVIRQGFQINWMSMSDFETGEIFWKLDDCSAWKNVKTPVDTTLPKALLKSKCVAREINFSSKESIKALKLVQRSFIHGQEVEAFEFKFGFVIPGSTNTWQQTIDAASEENMLPAEMLSGNLVVHTAFYDGEFLITQSKVRIFYS